MKKLHTLALATSVALLFILATGPALAQTAPAVKGHGPVADILRCLGVADLSAGQKAEIKAIFEAKKPVFETLFAQLKTDGEALAAAMKATPQDPCLIGAAFVKVVGDRTAIATEVHNLREAVGAVLTAEQKAKVAGCLRVLGGPGREMQDDPAEDEQ